MTTPATTPLTYNGYIAQIAALAAVKTNLVTGVLQFNDPNLNVVTPQMLNYAELRIQRDMDLLPSEIMRTGYTLTGGSNQFAISVNDFVTLQTMCVLIDGIPQPPLLPTTKEFLQNVYGAPGGGGVPRYYAPTGGDIATGGDTTNNYMVGPWPSTDYDVQLTGTTRLNSLYQFANQTQADVEATFISTQLPDLLLMASMIYLSGYQRNFGRQSDDPGMAVSYESQYQVLLKGAVGEEYRKKFEAAAWSAEPTSPVSTPTR